MIINFLKFKNSLIGKAIILFFSLVAIPALVTGLIGKKYILDIVQENASKSYEYSLDNLQAQLSHELFETKMNAYYVYLDLDLKKAIKNFIDSPFESINAQKNVHLKLENYRISSQFSNVNAIKIYGFNGLKMTFGDPIFSDAISDEWVLNNPLYDYALKNPDEFVWSSIDRSSSKGNIPNSISLFRVIKDRSYHEDIGMLYINLDLKLFSTVLSSYNNRGNGKIYVLDLDSNTLSGEVIPSYILDKLIKHYNKKTKFSLIKLKEKNINIYIKNIPDYNWLVVGVLDLETVTDKSYQLFDYFSWGFIIFLVMTSFIWLSAVTNLLAPIKELQKATRRIRNGDLTAQVSHNGKDELAELTQDFNFMVCKIDNLVKSQVAQKEREKDAEYRALQAQINPHFLYNTLNSIRWMAIIQKASNIKSVIEALARLLRNSTYKMDPIITVAEEFSVLKDYVAIELVAYNNKFNVIYKIDDDAKKYKCLKFILQPLVENAIFHGVLPKDQFGEIIVEAKKVDQSILLSVFDNGIGYDTSAKSFKEENHHFNSIGLDTLKERLKAYHPTGSGIIIESIPNQYTLVTIELPLMEEI
ncbi:sensor histidine kinase [Marinomonas sp. 15G1-11]|uniref:Sensor histidine kinase n=1 Tax=Marinomonas phaeophyticola TaxID=3004091 RepID=A0ABT4JQF8_9GAMM|nr:sensor histidine kinase [Marinomonas sp. 15G1-11]MCZ2720401.1 sensor histidine kinase [Marinomonas sp. 15G1-11]